MITHVNADFDGVGGVIGALRLYPGARAVLPGGCSPACRDFLSLHRGLFEPCVPGEILPEAIARLILVDCAAPGRLGECESWLHLPSVEIHRIDHHADEASLASEWSRVEPWGAACSVVAAELRDRGITPTPFEATALLLGIHEDTGSFSHSGASPEDLEAASWLMRSGADVGVVAEFLHPGLTPQQRELLTRLVAGRRLLDARGVPVVLASAPGGPYVEDASLLVRRLMETERVEAAFILLEMEDAVYVIGRAQNHCLDVAAALRELGGGGHRQAGSAIVRDQSLESVTEQLTTAILAGIIPERTARELMSYPVRTISPNATILEARRRLGRYGHSGLVVTDHGRLAGILSRRDVDKASRHRLDHAPVKAYMTRDVHSVGPAVGLGAIERLMIREDIGRVPVVDEGEVIGIVTRTDVLKALHGARYVEEAMAAEPGDTAGLLRARLPLSLQQVLESAGREAAGMGAQAYLVGGPVRDLLLDVRNLDLDLLVEPDGHAFAAAWAESCGGVVTKVERLFGTAKVVLPGPVEVDVATARTESYERPGALPEVEASSVGDDLRRRDFTLNAMAIALNPEQFGRLLDPFGGRRDLEERRIRILHNLGFVEDPTRIFRAVRFESRLHFRMDRHTARLAREAAASGGLHTISPERLIHQFELTVLDQRPVGALLRLEELGVLRGLHPDLRIDQRLLKAIPGALAWWRHLGEPDEPDVTAVFLAGLLHPLGAEAGASLAVRLRIVGARLARVREALQVVGASDPLAVEGPPSALADAWRGMALETLLLAIAARGGGPEASRSRALLRRYLKEWRHVRLEITGDDLKAEGYRAGPAMGAVLRAVLAARLDGAAADRPAQLALAREILDNRETEIGKD